MSHTAIIELDRVVFKRDERLIFDELSLNIAEHQLTALMGPSGIGKTTLIKLICAQEKPVSGMVRVFGENIHQLSRHALFELRKRMGVLFQSGALLGDLTVFDNVALPLRENTRLRERIIKDIVIMKLQAVGLRAAKNLFPRELSGGMARRVGLARVLAQDPQIIMYDEPFAGQDPITMNMLVKLIASLSENLPITSIAISHDVQEILSIADVGYLLFAGKAYGGSDPETLFNDQSPIIKQFLNGDVDGTAVPFHMPSPISLEAELST